MWLRSQGKGSVLAILGYFVWILDCMSGLKWWKGKTEIWSKLSANISRLSQIRYGLLFARFLSEVHNCHGRFPFPDWVLSTLIFPPSKILLSAAFCKCRIPVGEWILCAKYLEDDRKRSHCHAWRRVKHQNKKHRFCRFHNEIHM